jgi:two-component system sensor histidine kinase UhpB
MDGDGSSRRRRYLPLVYRVAGLNALLLVTVVLLTLVVLAPRKFSSVAVDEATVLAVALILVAVVPGAAAASEAGELAMTFNEMLARLEAERREATGRVLAGQEAERLRIAQELHDQVGQELTAVLLGLARLHARPEPPLRDDVSDVQEAVRSSPEDVRRIALELRPEALDDLGLVSALAVLCERFGQRSGVTVDQHFADELPELGPEAELVVYRVAQEALTNVARHAGVDRAELSLRAEEGGVVMAVSDRGPGIPAATSPGTGMRAHWRVQGEISPESLAISKAGLPRAREGSARTPVVWSTTSSTLLVLCLQPA